MPSDALGITGMYYPYFRGKQYELITIRENAELMATNGFIPIIEPVKESLTGLIRSLDAVSEKNGKAILITNPGFGDFCNDASTIEELLAEKLKNELGISAGITLNEAHSVDDVLSFVERYKYREISLIHSGFKDGRVLSSELRDCPLPITHIFLEQHCGKLYRKNFAEYKRILIRDGFQKRTNRHHPRVEFFSDLHATFRDEGMNGFGDFLIVGDDYSESGGPAYAVVIHLTGVDEEDQMQVHHFKSIRQDTPTDPAGKFGEALEELVNEVSRPSTCLQKTDAVKEFLELYARSHFPGLGYAKKLSMKHHIETMAIILNRN